MKRGLFITFEGIEGSGKSTHAKFFCDYLNENGMDALLLREPGGTVTGEKIRDILLDKNNTGLIVEAELLLYNAARVQIVAERINPALKSGKVVICDRFADSTVAYQAYGGGLDVEIVKSINNFAALGVVPDFTVLLDSDVERGLERSGRGDRMELKPVSFHEKVRAGFLKLAENNERFFVVPEVSIDEGRNIIIEEFKKRFNFIK